MKKTIQAWAIYDLANKDLFEETIRHTGKECRKDWCAGSSSITWKQCHKADYRCIKVKIEYEVED